MTTPAGPSSSLQPHSTVMKNTNEKNTLEAWRNWELMNGGTDFEEPDPFDVTRTPRSIKNDSDGDDADNDNDDDDDDANNNIARDISAAKKSNSKEVKVAVSPAVRKLLSSTSR